MNSALKVFRIIALSLAVMMGSKLFGLFVSDRVLPGGDQEYIASFFYVLVSSILTALILKLRKKAFENEISVGRTTVFIFLILLILAASLVATSFYEPVNKAFNSGLYAVICGAVVEELIFRCIMLCEITSEYGFMKGAVISSFVFGAMHLLNVNNAFDMRLLLYVVQAVVFGMILSYVVHKTKGLYIAVIAHVLWNILSITVFK
ncbi:MAG: CPBP family intramembrane metalloprotease [Butyrivibrio sp.]|nr:CPBP family intramembrane metalloprotease [Butyrivibrio sp.]